MDTTVEKAVAEYLANLRQEGKSEETVLWHVKKLTSLKHFLVEQQCELVRDLTINHGRDFIRSLQERETLYPEHPFRQTVSKKLAPLTVHGFGRSIKAFASFLQHEGYTEMNVFKGIKLPKLPKPLVQPLTEPEILRLLAAIPQDTPEGARNYAILLTFVDCGIRLTELRGLKISDVDFGGGEFKVWGKGAKEREVPMGQTVRRAMLRYVEHFRPEPINPQHDYVFLSVDGTPLTKDAVEKLCQRLAKKSGIARLHPHLLRHTFAVRYLINGGDIFTLQKILGHEALEMVQRYLHLANTDVKDKHRYFSPIDNLGIVEHRRGRPKKPA